MPTIKRGIPFHDLSGVRLLAQKKRITGVGPAIQFLQMAILLYFLKSMGVFVGTRGHFMPIYIFILQLPPHPSIL